MAGRNWLTAKLLHEGFQVAIPAVDHGIDLLVFDETGEMGVRALPLQLKCANEEQFSLHTKYSDRGIAMVYVWNALDSPRAFILTYEEALQALGDQPSRTASWKKGHYAFTRVPPKLRERLLPYENRWSWLREHLASRPASGTLR